MSISRIAASLRLLKLNRKRRGYTMMEAILVLAIGSILVFGLGILVISVRENIWINTQLRNAEEYGKNYCHTWEKVVRNAVGTRIRRVGPPAEFEAEYMDPDDPIHNNSIKDYLFKFNNAKSIPEIRVNGRVRYFEVADNYTKFPPSTDRRDNFEVYRAGRKGFKIERCTRANIPASYRDKFLTMSFTILYRREPTFTGGRWFSKEIPFTASAYTVNTSWPVNYLDSSLVP
ncbi:MAG: prepilin-type N-terminal cleavage/methylation domain-containing protein [Candidatus Electryonea clarkiae]|nr:prepilin-type N-terminal cleavage/methylation domain-containing protein [Candidatus Electryonea clarkiae]MDP8288695.1 prepilin-type N-terminal cleavage/methylation domain-containing protein [Candidatus Electryonea clarkiae]